MESQLDLVALLHTYRDGHFTEDFKSFKVQPHAERQLYFQSLRPRLASFLELQFNLR